VVHVLTAAQVFEPTYPGERPNSHPLLGTPPTVTTTLPVVAPLGTFTTMLLAPQMVAVPAAMPLNVTVLPPCVAPKSLPPIVTAVPATPEGGDRLVMLGSLAAKVAERVAEHLADEEILIGNYVLSGGQPTEVAVVDREVRLLPGVLGNEASSVFESFQDGAWRGIAGLPALDAPGGVPGVEGAGGAIGGNHEEIRKFRRQSAREKTQRLRSDLVK
jgi:tRNA (guanine-N1)-methyltransferase